MQTMAAHYQYRAEALAERALTEFARAMRGDRMVAVIGSMASEALGYYSWDSLKHKVVKVARPVTRKFEKLDPSLGKAIDAALDCLEGKVKAAGPATVHFSVLRGALAGLEQRYRDMNGRGEGPLQMFEKDLARLFLARNTRVPLHGSDAIAALRDNLGISRVATLNYDFELERALMLTPGERGEPARTAHAPAKSFLNLVGEPGSAKPISRLRGDKLVRRMPDGRCVESDYLDRERVDRLFLFSSASGGSDKHILHLHGRADAVSSMVFDMRDYNRHYRLDDLYRNPLQHGLRVLFGGNPILFVGIGMSEDEINDTLQYFASNTPYRRSAPAFVLWNTVKLVDDVDYVAARRRILVEQKGRKRDAALTRLEHDSAVAVQAANAARRIDFLERLGVHLLSDEDIYGSHPRALAALKALRDDYRAVLHVAAARDGKLSTKDRKALRKVELRALARSIEMVPPAIWHRYGQALRAGDRWRVLGKAMSRHAGEACRLWGTRALKDCKEARAEPAKLLVDPKSGTPCAMLKVAIGAPGSGRGLFAEQVIQYEGKRLQLADDWVIEELPPKNRRLLVNAGFAYDSDATMNNIAEFLRQRLRKPQPDMERGRLLAQPDKLDLDPVLIVINGLDRFFARDGAPLCAELDEMLRAVRKGSPHIQWLLLGSERIGKYFRALDVEIARFPSGEERWLDSAYLTHVRDALHRRLEAPATKRRITRADFFRLIEARNGGGISTRRAFFDAYLDQEMLGYLFEDPELTADVLRTLAFIGSPVPGRVLTHAPAVRRHADFETKLDAVLDVLCETNLIIQLIDYDPHKETSELDRRFALHRSLATQYREAFAAPASEGKLSSAFNLSLFVAQPVDDYAPKAELLPELGTLVDRLIGGWRDLTPGGGPHRVDLAAFVAARDRRAMERIAHIGDYREEFAFRSAGLDDAGEYADFLKLIDPRATDCLRAALSVLRGYFSTAHLLTLPLVDGGDPAQAGTLSQHVERMDRLLRGFGKIAEARAIYRNACGAPDPNTSNDPADAENALEPFYPDDLVWLHNERGVAALTQGNLPDAERSFALALKMNEQHLEKGERGLVWRRIALNRLGLLVEQGWLDAARGLVREIDEMLERKESGTVDAIRKKYGDQDGFVADATDPKWQHEDILAVGLTTAYRGLIAHLRGRYRDAEERYRRGISMLRRLQELRAYSMFQRHWSEMKLFNRDSDALKSIERAVGAAVAVRQFDVQHRAQILRATAVLRQSTDRAESRQALEELTKALAYSQRSDCFRVRIEASTALAREMRQNGDYETALRYAADGLATARLHGHRLHIISLMVAIGQILIQRGDPISGSQMIEEATRAAIDAGYDLTLDRIQRVRRESG